MRRNSAFTLIELLVVIAIIAILAAILFPVFAEAKSSAKKTASLSGLKQLALGLQMYSTDFDDLAVHEYGFSTPDQSNFYLNGNTWVGRVMPYVKNRSIFWDKTVTEPTGDILPSVNFAPDTYRWEWTTTFSINTEGYSRHYGGSSCLDTNWSGPTSPRSLTGIEDSAQRLAITPVRVGGEQFGWMRFFYTDAAWPTVDRYASNFSWSQLVYDARRQYAGPKFIGAYADGHAGKYGREKFVGYVADNPAASDAQTWTRFCEVMTERDLHRFWGYAWSGN